MLRKLFVISGVLAIAALHAETGYDAWLRYAALDATAAAPYRQAVPAVVTALSDSAVLGSAEQECIRGIRGMLGRTLRVESAVPKEGAIVLGTLADFRKAAPQFNLAGTLVTDGFWLKTARVGGARYIIVTAENDRGVLYGSFALLRKIALGEPIADLDEKQAPYAPVRWLNLWDVMGFPRREGSPANAANQSGSFSNNSIVYENGNVREDLTRAKDFARLLASIGINGAAISNVNADLRILTPEFYPQLVRLAAAWRPWGIQVVLPVDLGSPKTVGGLDTFDPLDARVAAWWKTKVDELYAVIPDMAGFVMKADSEDRVGPSAYKRTQADAANVVARGLKPHGGLMFYRAFVYNHHLDWTVMKNDRARAAYDYFQPLDGQFDDNVVVQIKNGPIDFQVREPASPLFGALEKTSQAIELEVVQEYMGQARHLTFLIPQWKAALDFDMHAGAGPTPVKALIAGKVFHRPTGGFIGTDMTSMDPTWAHSDFAQPNLYGFGRLAWNPDLSSERIAEEWTRLTFGSDPKVVQTIDGMLLRSWRVYENYTGPLGLQTLTEITANHYGVAVEASENNGWGQWHRADNKGVGMDRTVATGTGYIGQYSPAVAKVYESLETCPDDLILWMHHVPYTYKLHSGKTVIQYLYDSHYEGAESAAGYVRDWKSLEGRVDEARHQQLLKELEYQAGSAQLWRDAVAGWFFRASGIPDDKGRVGHYPGRTEAESMKLDGYTAMDVTPWSETASGGKGVECLVKQCTASLRYDGPAGWYTLRVRYFDQFQGVSRFRLFVGNQAIAEWAADDLLPTRRQFDGTSSTRYSVSGVALRPGDEIRIEGTPDNGEPAAIDYIEIEPVAN